MRVLVVSDTHCKNPSQVEGLIDLLRPHAIDADMILHAGDLVTPDVIPALEQFAPTHAVRGNMDVTVPESAYPARRIVEADGVRIGMTHGEGPPFGLVERIRARFADDNVDVIVFGHTHEPFRETVADVLMLNPGSPTDRRFTDHNSIAVLDVGETVSVEIIDLTC